MVLATALDVAKGMSQLHSFSIVHSDCKPQNILLKSVTGETNKRGFTAKVWYSDAQESDFWFLTQFLCTVYKLLSGLRNLPPV